ncbi:metal-dependent phosphohydrolase [Duganella sp. FT80W]|uniref:Metal-dependent phosphohydrolase n=1 Tax=Duganella guangzhouensis TaxID=2666084 RepID=A0A6I2KTS4_9BURK|nr:metal-dependent phosphohydrolase [Duganella guangzhouensis]MRW88812.1 metal-dependent phosphohydrolase [Duganella guangzhouensis]
MSAHRPDILLRSGNFFNFLSPETSIITIEDIASGLANEARFNGQTLSFYSVAQHSVLVSLIVPPELAMVGLLHDCSEAVMKDLPKPLKRLLPDYQVLEQAIEAAILGRFGITLPLDPAIKAADLILLATEKRDLMPPHHYQEWPGVEPLAQVIVPMQPVEAYSYFMDRYHQLMAYHGAPQH